MAILTGVLVFGTYFVGAAQATPNCTDNDNNQYYEVATGTYTDHSDTTGTTIQGCLNEANTNGLLGVELTSYSYNVDHTIVVPNGLTLRNSSTSWQTGGKIVASSTFPTNESLVSLGSNAYLYKLELNGNHRAKHIVNAGNSNNSKIRLCALHKTSLTDTGPFHVINAPNTTDILIELNLIRRAGVSGPTNPTASPNAISGAAISVTNSTSPDVLSNDIAYSLSAGVDFTNSMNATVSNNTIQFPGMGALFSGINSADGITAYHNTLIPQGTSLNAVITGNNIIRWHNNGIHVTGRGYTINNNSIDRGEYVYTGKGNRGRTIALFDSKTPADCTYSISVQNNQIGKDSWGSYMVIGANHKAHGSTGFPGSIWPSQNTDFVSGSPLTNSNFTIWDNTPHC